MADDRVRWPSVEGAYQDEFGTVDPEVYRVAASQWPQAERLALQSVHDAHLGLQLLLKASAAVSRLSTERRAQIADLRGYLFQAYKRLILVELEKQNAHRRCETAVVLAPMPGGDDPDRDILIAQLVNRMDTWTREVFELLVLGFSFEEIGARFDQRAPVVRNRFRRALRRLRRDLGS